MIKIFQFLKSVVNNWVYIRDLAKSILKQKKYYSYKSRRKKTSINIYFIIQPFFHLKASKQ